MAKPEPMLGKPDAPEGGELEDAMSDLGMALSDKDWSAAAAAFRRACTICESDYEDDTDEE